MAPVPWIVPYSRLGCMGTHRDELRALDTPKIDFIQVSRGSDGTRDAWDPRGMGVVAEEGEAFSPSKSLFFKHRAARKRYQKVPEIITSEDLVQLLRAA